MQKWGKDARGNIRFRCKNCSTSIIRKRLDLTHKNIKRFCLLIGFLENIQKMK